MNIEFFISKRLFTAKEENNSYTRPILYIAIFSLALSMVVMLLSVMIVTGFKKEISDKAIGFHSHITITSFNNNHSYESEAISMQQDFYPNINEKKGVKHIQVFATKAGIIKNKNEILGSIIKGVGSDFDPTFFNNNLKEGYVPVYNDSITSNEVLISNSISNLLQINNGDDIVMYFVDDPARVRKFKVSGIYDTGFSEIDNLLVLADIRHIRKLNDWNSNQVGGFEILLDDIYNLDEVTSLVYNQIGYDLNAYSIKEKMPQIFDWLDLQDINISVILCLMLIVGGINMITVLLILVIERTRFIGVLKALGASNWSIRKIFLYSALNITFKGLVIGNIVAFALALLQKYFSLISLNPETYYMSTVPINFDFTFILALNIGTILICYLVLIIPSIIISNISPVKAISFE